MQPGETYALTMSTLGGGIVRSLMRVTSVGADCGGSNTGQLVTFGGVQALDDIGTFDYGQPIPYQVFGSESSDATEAAAHSVVAGPLDMDNYVGLQVTKGFTFAHQDYIGSGTCVDGDEPECDNGPLLTIGSGYIMTVTENVFGNTNSTYGSGGVLNIEPYAFGNNIESNLFSSNTGASLIDVSNNTRVHDNDFVLNTALSHIVPPTGVASTKQYLVRTQGINWSIDNNRFERNHMDLEYDSAIIEALTPYGRIVDNWFTGSSATSVRIQPGAAFVTIEGNRFDAGMWRGDDGSDDDEFGFPITVNGASDTPIQGVTIRGNTIHGVRFTGSLDTPPAIGSAGIQIKVTADSTPGTIHPMGVSILDNWFTLVASSTAQCTSAGTEPACNSAMLMIRGCDDPDNARIFVSGNRSNTGRIAFCQALPAGGTVFDLDSGANGETNDNGVGLLTCGANEIGGTWYTSRIAGESGRTNPSECTSAW